MLDLGMDMPPIFRRCIRKREQKYCDDVVSFSNAKAIHCPLPKLEKKWIETEKTMRQKANPSTAAPLSLLTRIALLINIAKRPVDSAHQLFDLILLPVHIQHIQVHNILQRLCFPTSHHTRASCNDLRPL